MKLFRIILPIVLTCCLVPERASSQKNNFELRRSVVSEKTVALTDNNVAINRAMSLTDFTRLSASTPSAQFMSITKDETPFVGQKLIGRNIWRVDISHVALKLKSASQHSKDRYLRSFSFYLDPNTGQLYKAVSQYDGTDADLRPPPTASSAEKQMQASHELYHAWGTDVPRVSLLDALDAVLSCGIGSPLEAKEITAVYVLESTMGSPPRPVWAITLNGIPPLTPLGKDADSVPIAQRNHVRNVIDATTGQCLFATSIPQPDN